MSEPIYDYAIIGGGIAGLTCASLLAGTGASVAVIEQKAWPHHKVCGEYVSREVEPLLMALGVFDRLPAPAQIDHLQVSSISGRSITANLDLGGYGISRFAFDHALAQSARSAGATLFTEAKATEITQVNDIYTIKIRGKESVRGIRVLGAWGKRSTMDEATNRPFIKQRSPWVGVKHHVKADFPAGYIALHNFSGGYCGINAVEDGIICICYLIHRNAMRSAGSIAQVEEQFLFRNPHLKAIMQNAEYIYKAPLVINEVSFSRKSAFIGKDMLMLGDGAGMIAPLCGNGMAMAMHSALLAAIALTQHGNGAVEWYKQQWNASFSARLSLGRLVQSAFGKGAGSSALITLGKILPFVVNKGIIPLTHGNPRRIEELCRALNL